VFLGVGP